VGHLVKKEKEMSIWLARAKKRYRCDICGKIIQKGEERYCEGYRCLAYTMIDKNICKKCYNSEEKKK